MDPCRDMDRDPWRQLWRWRYEWFWLVQFGEECLQLAIDCLQLEAQGLNVIVRVLHVGSECKNFSPHCIELVLHLVVTTVSLHP